jgi:hypothetical protein
MIQLYNFFFPGGGRESIFWQILTIFDHFWHLRWLDQILADFSNSLMDFTFVIVFSLRILEDLSKLVSQKWPRVELLCRDFVSHKLIYFTPLYIRGVQFWTNLRTKFRPDLKNGDPTTFLAVAKVPPCGRDKKSSKLSKKWPKLSIFRKVPKKVPGNRLWSGFITFFPDPPLGNDIFTIFDHFWTLLDLPKLRWLDIFRPKSDQTKSKIRPKKQLK